MKPSTIAARAFVPVLMMSLIALVAACQSGEDQTRETASSAAAESRPYVPEVAPIPGPPPAFEAITAPADNPMSPEKVALGRQLFFDNRLSGDGTRSCYSCHLCEHGLTDGLPTAVGAFEKQLTRSSPTLWNIGYHTEFYWDGRSASLESQAMAAWKGGNMGADPNQVVGVLNGIDGYKKQFQTVFGSDATPDNVVAAIAAFERTLYCGTTAFDRFNQGDKEAMSEGAQRGWTIWREKAGCGSCHAGILFTDLQYHNVGIGMDAETPDIGRNKVTGDEKDTGAFKTPTLRDVSRSFPYFHDGSAATLREAVDIMLAGGKPNPHLDTKNLSKVELTDEEKNDLLEFLRALNCECTLTPPVLPGAPMVM